MIITAEDSWRPFAATPPHSDECVTTQNSTCQEDDNSCSEERGGVSFISRTGISTIHLSPRAHSISARINEHPDTAARSESAYPANGSHERRADTGQASRPAHSSAGSHLHGCAHQAAAERFAQADRVALPGMHQGHPGRHFRRRRQGRDGEAAVPSTATSATSYSATSSSTSRWRSGTSATTLACRIRRSRAARHVRTIAACAACTPRTPRWRMSISPTAAI